MKKFTLFWLRKIISLKTVFLNLNQTIFWTTHHMRSNNSMDHADRLSRQVKSVIYAYINCEFPS